MTAAQACASVATHCVDLIDKDDGCGGFARVFKQIAHTRCTYADVHFHKIRTRDREEGNACLTGNRLCKQGLTRTGRAHEQNAVGDLCAKAGELAGSLEELHDLLQLLLFLICTRYVLEADLVFIIRHGRFDARLAEVVDLVALAAGALHGYKVEHNKDHDNERKGDKGDPCRHYHYGLVDHLFDQAKLGELNDLGAKIALEVLHICDLVAIGFFIVCGVSQGIALKADDTALDAGIGNAVAVGICGVGKRLDDFLIVLNIDDLLLVAVAAEQHDHNDCDQGDKDDIKQDHLQIILHA